MASASEENQLVEVFQLEAGAGPGVECYRTGDAVTVEDIAAHGGRWPPFQSSALSQGFRSLHAVPMRLRSRRIGALNLLRHETGSLTSEDAELAQALADVATITLLQERAARETVLINEQLKLALSSRILIEQAKGMIAQTSNVDMNAAFTLLRNYARAHNQTLRNTSEQLIHRVITL